MTDAEIERQRDRAALVAQVAAPIAAALAALPAYWDHDASSYHLPGRPPITFARDRVADDAVALAVAIVARSRG